MLLKKIVRFLDNLIDRVLLLVFILAFLMGFYGLYDSFLVYQSTLDNSLLKFKPGYGSEEEIPKEIKGNMVAWLTLDNTIIDYPVMQGIDNNEYLNKNPYGEYSLSGSIFLDSRNSSDFSDEYSLIYGHHMEHGMMFGALDEFLNEDYFNSHQSGELIVNNKAYDIQIFAVVESDATCSEIFDPISKDITLPYIEKHALYLNKNNMFTKKENLLGISTCKYPDTTDRTIVFYKIKGD